MEQSVAGASNPEQLLAFGRRLRKIRSERDSADRITRTGDVRLSNGSPELIDVGGALAFNRGQGIAIGDEESALERQFNAMQEQRAQALQQQQQTSQSIISQLMNRDSQQETLQQQQEEFGIPAILSQRKIIAEETGALESDHNKTKAEMQEAINRTRDNSIGAQAGAIDSNVAKIERDYGVRLNRIAGEIKAKQGVAAALQGDLQLANSFINEAVDAFTADQKFKVDSLKFIRDENADLLNKVDSIYKDSLEFAIQREETEYERARQEMKDYWKAQGGTGDSVDEDEEDDRFTTTQINTGAARGGFSVEEFEALPTDVKNYYINRSASQRDSFDALLSQARDGEDLTTLFATIDQSNQPQTVKEHMKELLREAAGSQTIEDTGGFWDRIGRLFESDPVVYERDPETGEMKLTE